MRITFDKTKTLSVFNDMPPELYYWYDFLVIKKNVDSLVVNYEDMDRYIYIECISSTNASAFTIKSIIDDNDIGSFMYDRYIKSKLF